MRVRPIRPMVSTGEDDRAYKKGDFDANPAEIPQPVYQHLSHSGLRLPVFAGIRETLAAGSRPARRDTRAAKENPVVQLIVGVSAKRVTQKWIATRTSRC